MPKDSELLKKILKMSIEEIDEVLSGTKEVGDLTRVAGSVVGNYVKLKQVECHEEATKLARQKFLIGK